MFKQTLTRAAAIAALCALPLAAACGQPPVSFDVVSERGDAAAPEAATLDAGLDAAPDAPADDVRDEGTCRSAADCDDGVFCNGAERCLAGVCQAGRAACDDGHSCTRETCEEDTRTCVRTPDAAPCQDTNLCNGVERCDPAAPGAVPATGCVPPRTEEIDCNDGNTCTLDSCDAMTGCVHAPRDLDDDGHVDRACTLDGRPGGPPGDDCNDGDAQTYPGAMEICDDSRDNNCNGSVDLEDLSGCTAANDTCATATVLPGAGTYRASTAGLADDYALGCATAGAFADAVFEFTTTALQDVMISTSARGTTAAVALVSDCGGTELRCNRATGTTTSPSVIVRSLAAGTYRIVVETGAVPAAFNLTLALDPATPIPGGDVCPGSDADPVLDVSDGMPHTARLSALENEYTLACRSTATGASARDAVFRLVVTEPSDVSLVADAPTGTTYVDLRRDPCGPSGASLQCASGTTSVGGGRLRQRNVMPGTYWVFVENSSTTNPDVTVTATLSPPVAFIPNDRCPEGAADPVEELNDGLTHTVRLSTLDENFAISCRASATGTSNRDGVLRLTLAAPQDVILRGSAITGTTFVALRGAPCATATDIGCFSGDPAVNRFRALPAGEYFVFVENNSTTNPDLYVTATLQAPTAIPAGDVCPSGAADPVIELNDGIPHIALLGSMDDNYALSCSSAGRRDAVFRLTLAADSDVTIDANALGSGTTYVSVRAGDCATDAGQRRCYSTSTGQTYVQRGVRAGTYWVHVESSNTADPEVRAVATITPVAARTVGDSCANPAVITPDAPPVTVVRSTVAPGADVGTTCGTDPGPGSDYSDAVFTFTLAARRDVTVTASRTGTGGTTYWQLARACDRSAPVGACATTSTVPGTRVYRNLEPGTYYIVAETLLSTTTLTGWTFGVTTAAASGGYVASSVTGATFTDACTLPGAVMGVPAADDAVLAIPNAAVGFPVRYYNTAITTALTASTNGWLALLATTASTFNGSIGSTSAPNNVIGAYWRDLDTRTPGVCYATTGAAGSRQFIVQWNDATHHLSAAERLTFQVIINEAPAGENNPIDLVYQTMTGADTVSTTRAGVENSDGTLFTVYPGPYAPLSATEPRVVRLTYAP